MSSGWKFGKKLKDVASHGHRSQPHSSPGSPVTPTPPTSTLSNLSLNSASAIPPAVAHGSRPPAPPARTGGGTLTIRVVEAKGLTLPSGIELPPAVASAMGNEGAQAGSVTVGSLARAKSNRDSVQRKRNWWLPYLVLGFDMNEVLVDCLGGTLESPVWMYKTDFDVCRSSDLTISAYLRTDPGGGGQNDMGNDIFLCGLAVRPVFDASHPMEQWYAATLGSGRGLFHLQMAFRPPRDIPLTIDSFELLKVVGKGSFGKVMQVRKKDTGRIYALKTIRKAHIVSRSEVTHTLAERTVLGQVSNPFIVPLKFSFQSAEKLYLVLAFVNGGELFHHLQREGKFNEERARFYAAELLCALECLHAYDVIYRDLKPENILLDYTGHIALCDFGLCKLNMGESEKTNTFCGTPEYLSPELLQGLGYAKTVDWWTLGVLLYEMLSGLPPYYDENVNEMYRKILQHPLCFGDEIRPEARSLLTGLLNRDPNKRLGVNGSEEIKRHPFFAKIDWKKLVSKGYQPPFKPSVKSAIDTSNFDSEFTNEAPMDSVVEDSHLSQTVQEQFAGFTYNPSEFMSVR